MYTQSGIDLNTNFLKVPSCYYVHFPFMYLCEALENL
jgi:hypothetical protein